MSSNRIYDLQKLGVSVWCDYIQREGLLSGDIRKMIETGEVTGITSNPTIFDKAISSGAEYDEAISNYLKKRPDCTIEELYEAIAIEDIRMATELLKPVFDRTNGRDGYVSLEVSPHLAYETEKTLSEVRRLHRTVARPNLMIKVPATKEGFPAIRTLIGEGFNINVTLIFSLEKYEDVAEAYLGGLEKFAESGGDVSTVASVASLFVSRIDTMVDKQLSEDSPLRGKIAVANSAVAYARSREIFTSDRFKALEEKGARLQRVLWGSTGTKNPAYRDVLYVEELIGPDIVNTIPPVTIDAFRDHGKARSTLSEDASEARNSLDQLKKTGIDLDEVTRQLTTDGVDAFIKSFDSLLDTLSKKKQALTNKR